MDSSEYSMAPEEKEILLTDGECLVVLTVSRDVPVK